MTGVPRARAVLLLIALAAPLAVLALTGARLAERERELERDRAATAHRQQLEQCAQALLARLEQMKLAFFAEATQNVESALRGDGAERVAIVGLVRGNELILPWEDDPRTENARRDLRDGAFATRIAIAEQQSTSADAALNAAARAKAQATTPVQRAYAAVVEARLFRRARRDADALRAWRAIRQLSPELVDDNGIPFAFYALPNLRSADPEPVLRGVVNDGLRSNRFLAPAALYLARDAVGETEPLAEAIRVCERARNLQQTFPELGLNGRRADSQWVATGDPAWLAGVSPRLKDGDAIAIAVPAADVMKAAYPQAEVSVGGEPLAPALPGLRVAIKPAAEGRRPASVALIWIAVAFAASAAAGGAAMLWRDMRRDARMAALRSQFIASVSHELRTPLAAIRMFAETMKLDPDLGERERGDYLDTILSESERLSRLVDNVLNFSRMERGRTTYRLAAVAVDDLLQASARALQPALEQAGFRLSVACEPGLANIHADRDAVQQAILNLLANAMKYSGAAREVELRAERKEGFALISVVDHGIGIAPEERRRIFERFYRAAVVENKSIPGAGLGLTLVEHIARAHGGDVQVASEPGGGSTFTLRIPVADAVAAEARGAR